MPAGTTVLMVAAVVAGLALGGLGLRWIDDGAAPAIVIEDAGVEGTIVVAVEGAVATPGVYGLGQGARMQDALDRAGGMVPGADLAAVNPAQRLQDEQRVVVP